jgi:hydroxymethylpyrimidine pyrophosphatase-like HAD family hydrolase
MSFAALATDYDGTLAHDGVVDPATVEALTRFKATSRRLVLVTGRQLPDVRAAFPQLSVFDRVVAENGAVTHDPRTGAERVLGAPPPSAFLERLNAMGISPLSVGRSIVATWEPHGKAVRDTIGELGLELQIVFNKGAVMVLPPGIDKASGLVAALDELGLSHRNVVAVGDAENDLAFLQACGCSAAVGNALPMLKRAADIELTGDHGAGVVELIDRICRNECATRVPRC